MNCYLNIWNPRSPTVPSSFLCDYCRGPFTLYSRRLSSNVVGQGVQSRVSNPLVDGRWTCGCWITCAKKVQGERNQACLKLLSRCLSSTKLIHPKTSIIRLSTIRAIEYDWVRFCFVRHKNVVLFRQKNKRTWEQEDPFRRHYQPRDLPTFCTFPSNFCPDTWIRLRLRVRQG